MHFNHEYKVVGWGRLVVTRRGSQEHDKGFYFDLVCIKCGKTTSKEFTDFPLIDGVAQLEKIAKAKGYEV